MPIKESKISIKSAPKILIDLFSAAGAKYLPAESTARAWLNGTRNCKVISYFPNGEDDVKPAGIFYYFKKQSDNKLQQLQKIFRDKACLDPDSAIDPETDDLDLFCWGLVNQFLIILNLEKNEIPCTPSMGDEPSGNNQPLNSQSADAKSDVSDPGVDREQPRQVPNAAPAGDLSPDGSTDVLNKEKRSIRSMILPHEDDCCYYCAYWVGDRETFGAYTEPTYGRCRKHNGREQLSSNSVCKDYKKHQKLSGEW